MWATAPSEDTQIDETPFTGAFGGQRGVLFFPAPRLSSQKRFPAFVAFRKFFPILSLFLSRSLRSLIIALSFFSMPFVQYSRFHAPQRPWFAGGNTQVTLVVPLDFRNCKRSRAWSSTAGSEPFAAPMDCSAWKMALFAPSMLSFPNMLVQMDNSCSLTSCFCSVRYGSPLDFPESRVLSAFHQTMQLLLPPNTAGGLHIFAASTILPLGDPILGRSLFAGRGALQASSHRTSASCMIFPHF